MIEVEKKFALDSENERRLTHGMDFAGGKVLNDIYYDTPEYSLTRKDIWLRERNKKWELKTPVYDHTKRLADQYEETEDEDKIRKFLKLPMGDELGSELENYGYLPFAKLITVRRIYKAGKFSIDLDVVEAAGFHYALAEIETKVKNSDDVDKAAGEILEFAKKRGVRMSPVRGKVLEYLKRMNPSHYGSLCEAGVVDDPEIKAGDTGSY